jgi:hypothetical protein
VDEYKPEIDELVKWRQPVTSDDVIGVLVRYLGQPRGRISNEDAAGLAAASFSIENSTDT